jgi:hypothetical protein
VSDSPLEPAQRIPYHGLSIYSEVDPAKGLEPAVAYFFTQYGDAPFPNPSKLVHRYRLTVDPDYVPSGQHATESPRQLALSHGLEHAKALIDLNVAPGKNLHRRARHRLS